MAFSDLCHISNAYKSVENEPDQTMEENSMVRDLITKILDETGTTEGSSSIQPQEKTTVNVQNQFLKNDSSTFAPSNFNNFQNNMFNFQNEQNGFNYNLQNGLGNGFVNYNENDAGLLGVEAVEPTDVTPEQLNLLRLAAQEIGGAQFTNPNKFDEKFYNFFEPSQRNSLPDTNMFPVNNFNRPNSLNLEMNYNNFDNPFAQRFPNKFDNGQNQDPAEILAYLNQMNISSERRDEMPNNIDGTFQQNGHYQGEDFNKLQDQKMFFNRNFPPPPTKSFNGENFYLNDMMINDRTMNQNFDYSNQTPVSASNSMNFKPNGFHQNDFARIQMPVNQPNGITEQRNFENNGSSNMQQAALMRQNQAELARQMSLLMRNRPPPNQLNVDVSFLHENTPFNLGLGALLGPSPPVPPPVLPSPMLDLPLLAPFYAMRNMRGAATSSGILHARLDACYEQWRQLERERKRTEARLALAYPGRAVSSSNSIPVPRLPPCPTRVDRLTVDMLREHTKVLTLMGKMETLRASVCVAQNKKPKQPEDGKITVLKRGQENVAGEEKKDGVDPATFDPSTWRDDVKRLAEIEVESAMLSWRSAVAGVQAARRRELAPHPAHPAHPAHHAHPAQRYLRQDPILALAEAVKQLCVCARRARTAMWCDLTLTVALAPHSAPLASHATAKNESSQSSTSTSKQPSPNSANSKSDATHTTSDNKEEKSPNETTQPETKTENNNNSSVNNKNTPKQNEKQQDGKNQQRRNQNYRKLQRNDFYKNQRYDNRFMQNRHPYYLATGPIN